MIRIAQIIVVCGIFLLANLGQADVAQIKSMLKGASWVIVDRPEHVRFNPSLWKGVSDLSYRYKIRIHEATLYLSISVMDDRILFKDKDTIVSDHVEIWLADPELISYFENRLDQIRTGISSLTERVRIAENNTDRPMSERERVQLALKDLKQADVEYRKNKLGTQFIFNSSHILTIPKVETENVFFVYEKTTEGYDFFASVPLRGAFDIKDEALEALKYLVDISDVDDHRAKKQEKLMSSSATRVFSDISTFNLLKMDRSSFVEVDAFEKLKEQFESGGFYKAGVARYYRYLRPSSVILMGDFALEQPDVLYPGYFQDLGMANLSKQSTVEIYHYNAAFIFRTPRLMTVYEFPSATLHAADYYEAKVLMQNYVDNAWYVLCEIRGRSKKGLSTGQCGAGQEADLVWLKVDNDLKVIDRKIELIESCWKLTDEPIYRMEKDFVTVVSKFFKPEVVKEIRYDNSKPQAAFTVKTTSAAR